MSFVALYHGNSQGRRRGNRPDRNHADIRDGLKRIPLMRVRDTTQTGGPLDLEAYYPPSGRFRFIEVKNPEAPERDRKLTKKEREFIAFFPEVCCVVLSLDDALREMGVTT